MDRLTRDSIAAQRAGMTYGKWKMLHPHTEEEVEIPGADAKLCKICGKPFYIRTMGAGGKNRLYCSRECAHEARNEKQRSRYRKKGDKANGKI